MRLVTSLRKSRLRRWRWRTDRPETRGFAKWKRPLHPCCVSPQVGLAQFVASFGAAAVDNYRVVGTSGDLELDPGFRFETATKLRLRGDGGVSETQFPQIDHFGAQVAYFSDCIKAGTPPEADGDEGLADLRALIAIEKAALTGQPQIITSSPRSRHPTPDMVRLTPATDRRLVL